MKPGLFLQPFVVAQLSGAMIEAVVEGSEVTASEYAVTSWINVVGGATPTELAEDLGLAPTTLSAMIDRLVRKKQLRRVRHPEDGRSYRLELTPKGKATNARARMTGGATISPHSTTPDIAAPRTRQLADVAPTVPTSTTAFRRQLAIRKRV